MACVVHQKDCKQWFAELNTDLDRIMEITRYILNLYELWKTYDERKEVQALLQKMPKPTTQPVPRWSEPSLYRMCEGPAAAAAGMATNGVVGGLQAAMCDMQPQTQQCFLAAAAAAAAAAAVAAMSEQEGN